MPETTASIDDALALHRQGRLPDAAALYERVLAGQPAHFDALQLLGALRSDQGDPAAAVALLSRALAIREDAGVRLNLGLAWRSLGRPDASEAEFRRAVAVAPELPQAPFFLGNLLKETGRLAEAIACFRRAVALEPRFADARFNLGNALRQTGDREAALDSYRQAAALRPGHAETLFQLGQTLHELGRFVEAITAYDAVLRLAPGHAPTQLLRGDALGAAGRRDDAIEAYRRAIAAAPELAAAHGNLGVALLRRGQREAALDSFRRAIALAPGFVAAWYNQGIALRDLGRDAEAEASFRQVLALAPDHADAHTDLGLLELKRGDYAAGWRDYEWRWRAPGFPGRLPPLPPQWRGETPLAGRTLLVTAEQGLGDTLHFCRYLEPVADAAVTLAVQPGLAPLLAGQFARVEVVELAASGMAELHCPLLSLPLALGLGVVAEMPYLAADPARRAVWRRRLGPAGGLQIGLVWAGSPAHPNDRQRSIALAELSGLLALPGIGWHSLQKQVGDADRPAVSASPLIDHGRLLTDFAETAALVSELDLVISVDTAVAHLAGALGRPVWILLPAIADWRWGTHPAETDWYPTARLFRQSGGGWAAILREIAAALTELKR